MEVLRIAAFSADGTGGNPAGVVISDALPDTAAMQRVAREVGYSETAFAAPAEGGWRVRYFAPEAEVPFCGHATIALGAALALRSGNGRFPLILNSASITVEGHAEGGRLGATLQSPPTSSEAADPALVADALRLFGYSPEALDPRLPPAVVDAGARHLLLALDSRDRLAAMAYDLEAGRRLMERAGLVTVALVFPETRTLFHARNAFASGGVYEDPATGAAAAALGGYLRDLGWLEEGRLEVVQGEDMGMRSRIAVEITSEKGESVRVGGDARLMAEA
jgi:PhzF family phenazine biosynthesis protein